MLKNLALISALLFAACSKTDSSSSTSLTAKTKVASQEVYNEFVDILDRFYPLFPVKNLNLDSLNKIYSKQITATTSETELYKTLSTFFGELKDGHSSFTAGTFGDEGYERPMNENVISMVDELRIKDVKVLSSKSYFDYGVLKSDTSIGYVYSKRFEPFSETETETTVFKTQVDEFMARLKSKKGIILDMRSNGGGQTILALYLAGYFYDGADTLFLKQRVKMKKGSTRASLGEWITKGVYEGTVDARVEEGIVAYTPYDEGLLRKTGKFTYKGKVVELTSNGTGSAAEWFTTAMHFQNVPTVGDTTFGIFAGQDVFTLKNGWKLKISIHDVEDFEGKSYEGKGIPPKYAIIPTQEDLNKGIDLHMAKAKELILSP